MTARGLADSVNSRDYLRFLLDGLAAPEPDGSYDRVRTDEHQRRSTGEFQRKIADGNYVRWLDVVGAGVISKVPGGFTSE